MVKPNTPITGQHPLDISSSKWDGKDTKSIQQVISPLQVTERYQKNNITSMLQEEDITVVSQSVKKRNLNEDAIKKEKDNVFILKRLDSIFTVCREVPTTVKRILLGKGSIPSDFKCIFQKQITLTIWFNC